MSGVWVDGNGDPRPPLLQPPEMRTLSANNYVHEKDRFREEL
jgi:hypothetical protein